MSISGSELWRILGPILLTGIGIYGLIVLLAFFFQGNLLYFPHRDLITTPRAAGLDYESVTLTTTDGLRLHAWFVPHQAPEGVILFFHGNGGNISHRLYSLRFFHQLGWSTLIIDYRGYGQSEGKPDEQGTYLDAEAAWRYLTEERSIPESSIVLFGRSLGGAVAAWLAARKSPGALILESTFTSVPDLAADLYPFLPIRLMTRFHYSTVDRLAQIACPVLIIHSPDDDIVPFQHGRALYEAAREPRTFLEIMGSHNEGFIISETRYERGMREFLARRSVPTPP